MMIEKSGSIRLKDISVAGNLPPEQQALAAGMVRVTHLYQNIVFALVVKFACLVLVAVGLADMWAAIFADVGVMVLAVLNAIRALRVHNL